MFVKYTDKKWYLLVFFVFFQPKSILAQFKQPKSRSIAQASMKLGLENMQDPLWKTLKNNAKKVCIGLITNHTGKDQHGKRTIDVLRSQGLYIMRIFVPEHGLDGTLHASHDVHDSIDAKTGIPVVSLYGDGIGKKISANKLKNIDALIFDMQDSGMRHYTYISTLLYVLQAAATYNKKLIVLDRPNLLGACMEGPLVDDQQKSFISVASIPLRYGMTIGELAHYFNCHELEKHAQLHVVPMLNYNRNVCLTVPYTPLSPHLPTKSACYGYSLLGLLGEVRPIYIGNGTELAMQCVTLADADQIKDTQWHQLHITLKKYGIESRLCDYTTPAKKYHCHGLKLIMPNINKAASFQALLAILKFFHDNKVPLTFSDQFHLAVGTSKVYEYIIDKISYAQLMKRIDKQLTGFYQKAQSSFLYKPWPRVAQITGNI